MRLHNNDLIDLKKRCFIKDHCLFCETVVLTDNVLKEIASFCDPYDLEKMINVFTGVDISYDLEPMNKRAELVLKGNDWRNRSLCKEKEQIYDNQCMDYMNNCIGRMCSTNGTDYDRFGVGIVGSPSLLTKTSSVTFKSNDLKRNIPWENILLIESGNKDSDTDEPILPCIYSKKIDVN